MPWNGYRDHETDVGDGWDAIENCSLFVKGECRRRLGFGARVDLSSAVVVSAAELGSRMLCATAAGAVLSVVQSTGVVSSLATGLATSQRPTWASMNGRLYYANGTETRASDDGTALRTVGITAPASAASATPTGSGGVVTAGVHLFRYRYYDSTRNRYSNPSNAVSATVTAGQTVTVGYAASGDSTVDKVIIEMTPEGAETYYRAATITNSGSSTSINISDDTLIVQIAASRDGEFGHEPPPNYDIIAEHRQRLWAWKISTGYLSWSRALFPESWDAINYGRSITLDAGDTPSGMASFYSDFYLFGQRSMRRLIHDGDPAAAMVLDVPGTYGVFNHRCVIKVDGGTIIGWGRNGAWIITAMQPKGISKPIDATIESLADASNTAARFIAYEPERKEVLFFFAVSGSTYCTYAACYALESGEWTLYKYRQAMSYGVLNNSYTDRQVLAVCDANGYAWRVGEAANDGGNDGVMTVTSGSTTTVINGTNTATVGQMAYFPATGEERRITVASGSQITVTPAVASAPTAGQKVYIGSIRQRLVTDWNPGGGMGSKKRPTKYMIAVRPEGDMGTATVAYYQDFSGTAVPATSFAADTQPDGVSIAGGVITLDMDTGADDGYIPVPMPADWKRVIRAEIVAETPLDGVRFLEAGFRSDAEMDMEDE